MPPFEPSDGALAEALESAGVRARAAHPSIAVDEASFARHLVRHCGARGREGVVGAHVEDLFLALGCAYGDAAALARFEEAHLRNASAFVAHLRLETHELEEVVQEVRVRLLAPGPDGPKILGYSGKGPLGGWVRVAAVRIALALRARRVEHADADAAVEIASAEADPELGLARVHVGKAFKTAFETSLASLDPKESQTNPRHAGWLLRPAFLGTSSDRTASMHRGATIRTAILCDPLGTPPAAAVSDRLKELGDLSTKGNRERLTLLTQPDLCSGCHARINPIAFAFEAYDQLGAWQTQENLFAGGKVAGTAPIDTSVTGLAIEDGAKDAASGAGEVIAAIAGSAKAHACFAKTVFETTHLRTVTPADSCVLHDVEAGSQTGNLIALFIDNVANSVRYIQVTTNTGFWAPSYFPTTDGMQDTSGGVKAKLLGSIKGPMSLIMSSALDPFRSKMTIIKGLDCASGENNGAHQCSVPGSASAPKPHQDGSPGDIGTTGSTYLLSVWSTGSGGSLHEEHDVTGSRGAKILRSRGWVQAACKFVPVNPPKGQLMIKAYPQSTTNVTDFYVGKVDPAYPVPMCR